MKKKQATLDCYKNYNPQNNTYAMGYHSVYDLIDNAYKIPKTYIDLLPEEINIFSKPIIFQAYNGFYLNKESNGDICIKGQWINQKQHSKTTPIASEIMLIWKDTLNKDINNEYLVSLAIVNETDRENYLSVSNDGSVHIGTYQEEFTIRNVGLNQFVLKSANGYYLRADDSSYKIVADSKNVGISETFTIFNRHSNCRISSVSLKDNLYVFGLEVDRSLIYKFWNGTTWSNWNVIGTDIMSHPKVLLIETNETYSISIFAKHSDGFLKFKNLIFSKSDCYESYWSEWESTNQQIGSDPEGIIFDGKAHIFAQDILKTYTKHIWFNGDEWKCGCLDSNKHILSDIKCINQSNGIRIYARVTDIKGGLHTKFWNGENWSNFEMLGEDNQTIIMASDPETILFNNKLYIFIRGTDNHLWFLTDSSWKKTKGTLISSPKIVAPNKPDIFSNRLYIFAQQSDSLKIKCIVLDESLDSILLTDSNYYVSSDPEVLMHNDKIHFFVRGEESDLFKNSIDSGVYHFWGSNEHWDYELLEEQLI